MDAVFFEGFCGLLRFIDCFADGDDREIRAFLHRDGLIEFEIFDGAVIHIFDGVAAEADVGRLVIFHHLGEQRLCEVLVTRQIDAEPWDARHVGDVRRGMMRHAERAVADAARDADEFHIRMRVRDIDFRLLHGTRREEARGRHGKRPLAARGEAGADADEILLGDADFDELLWTLLGIGTKRTRAARVAAKDDDVLIFFALLEEAFREDFLDGLTHSDALLSSSSFSASASCSSVGTL